MDRPDIDAIRDGYRSFGGDPFVEELCDYIKQQDAAIAASASETDELRSRLRELEAERERFIQALGDIPQGIMTPTTRALLDGLPMQRGVGGYPGDKLRDAGRGHLAEP